MKIPNFDLVNKMPNSKAIVDDNETDSVGNLENIISEYWSLIATNLAESSKNTSKGRNAKSETEFVVKPSTSFYRVIKK